MSLTRSQVRELRAAGWTVIEEGPFVELRRLLRSVLRPAAHTPGRRGSR